MRRSGALWLAWCLAAPAGCGREIVLGDSESAFPGAANGGAAGNPSTTLPGGSAGQASAPVDAIGPEGELWWSTDHESGDLSDWELGGILQGGEYDWSDVEGYVDVGLGRSGSQGLVATINTAYRGEPSSGVRVYRRLADGPAYYSAWFKLEDVHTVNEWWSIFLFDARSDPLDVDTDIPLWDVRVVTPPEGGMALQFYDLRSMQGTLHDSAGRVAAGDWFELKAYLDYRPPNDTRLRVWVDDQPLFDVKGLESEVLEHVYWAVGNGADRLDPAESTLYVDDAAIRLAGAPENP